MFGCLEELVCNKINYIYLIFHCKLVLVHIYIYIYISFFFKKSMPGEPRLWLFFTEKGIFSLKRGDPNTGEMGENGETDPNTGKWGK